VGFVGEEFGDELFAGGGAVGMDGAGGAGEERVPFGQGLAFVHEAVGAGFGHPLEVLGMVDGQDGAVRDEFVAVGIAGAAAGIHVEQPAGDAGVVHPSGFLDLELVDAALGASVAEGFPFCGIEFMKLFGFPKGLHGWS